VGSLTNTVASTAPSASELAELDELRRAQPGLWLRRVDEGCLVLAGRLALYDRSGGEVDAYLVEISVPRTTVTEAVPEVFECGGRIPRIADRHVFAHGACCIELPVEYLIRPRQRLAAYVGGQVRSYFIAQSYFEQFGTWPHGELAHGRRGVIEFCVDRLGTSDVVAVSKTLGAFDKWSETKHRPCPCGSQRKFLKCHGAQLRAARAWPSVARAELLRLLGALPK
jgi:hypothetical protein